MPDAFAEQIAIFRSRIAAGMPRAGWKIGINVPEVQRRLGLTHALVGWLAGDRVIASGASIAAPAGAKLHVEPELCIRMASAFDIAQASPEQAFAAVGGIAPALEVVDYALPVTGLPDVIRCSMFHHATVLGAWRPPCRSLDIASAVTLEVDGKPSEAARPDLVPTDVAEIVLHVAKLLAQEGEQLAKDDLILTGSFTAKAQPINAGQAAHANLGTFGEVSITLTA